MSLWGIALGFWAVYVLNGGQGQQREGTGHAWTHSRVSPQTSPCACKDRCQLPYFMLGRRPPTGMSPSPKGSGGQEDRHTDNDSQNRAPGRSESPGRGLRNLSFHALKSQFTYLTLYFRWCSFPWDALLSSLVFSYRTIQWHELFHSEKEEKVFSQF